MEQPANGNRLNKIFTYSSARYRWLGFRLPTPSVTDSRATNSWSKPVCIGSSIEKQYLANPVDFKTE